LQLVDLYTMAKSLGAALAPHLQPTTLARLVKLQPVAAAEEPARAAAAEAAGTLAEKPGESSAERQARIKKAAQGATDISGLVKSRKSQKPAMAALAEEGAPAANGNGLNRKRKLEDEDDAVSEKKVRFGE
jgi:hypothetical protein